MSCHHTISAEAHPSGRKLAYHSYVATVHRLSPAELREGTIPARLVHLAQLEIELGLAEARHVVLKALLALGVALMAAIALVAALVVLLAGAVAALLGLAWAPLVIAGAGVALLALLVITWSVWRLRRLAWPHETLTSLQENWRWLGAQLRSRLTLR